MNLEIFELRARRMWDEIPEAVREGVATLAIEAKVLAHPDFDWVYTMGECISESWPSRFGGEGDTRSELVLYHGSFEALSGEDPTFDWEGELWETILHELLHHREAAAGEASLEAFDWAAEQNIRRLAGEPYDPDFCRAIPAGSDGVVRLDSELFVESIAPRRSGHATFEWRGKSYTVRVPVAPARAFVEIRNLASGRLCVVVRRPLPWWRFGRLRREESGVVHLVRSALPLPVAGP